MENNARYIAAPIKRDASSWRFNLTLRRFQFYCANRTVEIVRVNSHIVLCRNVNRVIIDRFDMGGEKLLLPFDCVASIIGKCKYA